MRDMRANAGKVYLIGAGPGAADLLTLRAARLLAAAEVVLVDALVDAAVLAHCARSARIVHVGKRAGFAGASQAFIQQLMLRHALEGRVVARLKGGDPFVFGRGGEEADWLRRRGVAVEVVPGLTSGTAVPAACGIPVTHRGIARGVTFVTAHAGDGSEPDWPALLQSRTTLVVYMGLQRLERIACALMAAGASAATPVAVIAQGTLSDERAVFAPLHRIATDVRAASLPSPALIVIGEVVALAGHSDAGATARARQSLELTLEAVLS